ncbi:MAG: hypothetical protein A4E20_00240 [Nitrospira sp. SG-bin2]|jgi:hypothetical protein|nr:MAG: hypothetical protein A4E20_00240 [Nitrospira sp. SG-bin2]
MHVERTTKGDGSLFLALIGNLMVRYQHMPRELGRMGSPELALVLPYDFSAIDMAAAWMWVS